MRFFRVLFSLLGGLALVACTAAPALPSTAVPTPAAATATASAGTQQTLTSQTSEAKMFNQPKRTLNIAHRGARSLAPENTLAAARKGLEIGADMWELDVAMTRDGELVVIHDDTLTRTSNVAEVFPDRKNAPIQEFTMAELRKLDFGTWFVKTDPFKQIAAGKVSQKEQEAYKGEPIPTLRQALEFTRDAHWYVNVEIKDATGTATDATLVEKVVALIKELGMVHSVMISSFNHSYIQRVKKAEPGLVTAALVEQADADPAALLRRTQAQAYNPAVKAVTPDVVRSLRGQGFDVFIYTVNDEATMKTFIAAGASGLFTDFPQLMKEVLAKN